MVTRILVVDDDPIGFQITSKTLSSAGYEVLRAGNGAAALQQVDEWRPDLIILDVLLPDMDGYEVCRRLRRNAGTAHLPILVLTSQESLEERIKSFEAGADEFITIPYQPPELQARVKVLLQRVALKGGHESPHQEGKIIAVFSLRGGVGVSTLAANLAISLAQLWNVPTALVDLCLMAGQSALMLNIAPRNTWADLADVALETIDAELVNNVLMPHASGTFLLAAPRRPEESERIAAERVARVLSILSAHYQYIVLDLPHDFHATTLAGLNRAQAILALMAPDLASVRAMSSALDVFASLRYPRENICLVLNTTFEHNALEQSVIENALRSLFDLVIPFAPEVVGAINAGIPVVMGAPNTRVGAVLEDFAFQISKTEHHDQRPEHPTKAWQRTAHRIGPQKR